MQTQTKGAALELGTSSVRRLFHFWAYLGSSLLKTFLSAPAIQHLHCYMTHRNKIQLKDQRTTTWRKMILWKSEHFPFGVLFHLFLFLFMCMFCVSLCHEWVGTGVSQKRVLDPVGLEWVLETNWGPLEASSSLHCWVISSAASFSKIFKENIFH